MLGICTPANEEGNEIKIEVGEKIILTCGDICEFTQQAWMTFDRDDFKAFLQKAIEIIDQYENGKA